MSRAPSLPEVTGKGSRILITAVEGTTPATLRANLCPYLDAAVSVQPLRRSSADREDGGRRFLVTVGRGESTPRENAFDLAAQCVASPGVDILRAEPDLPAALMTGNVVPGEEAWVRGIPFCNVPVQPDLAPDWHLASLGLTSLWAQPPGGVSPASLFGADVAIAHPDTGWVNHIDLDQARIDKSRARNLVDNEPEGRDPLRQEWFEVGPIAQPGHGLGTGSVIISGHQLGRLAGVAPGATLLPIRTTKHVWQVFSANVTRAIDYAVLAGCHVISISLGGFFIPSLEEALNYAVKQNLIVCAAAGNCIQTVAHPAAFPHCIAVAATDSESHPWRGTSRGSAVDIAAPGVNVWVARPEQNQSDPNPIDQSQGTSPATAAVAGIGALWLARHGRDDLLRRYDQMVPLQHVFRFLLRKTATVPTGWDHSRFGAGIANAQALLAEPLPSAAEVQEDQPRAGAFTPSSPAETLSSMSGLPIDQTRRGLAIMLPSLRLTREEERSLEPSSVGHVQEIAYLIATDRACFLEFSALGEQRNLPTDGERKGASAALTAHSPIAARASTALKSDLDVH